MRGATASWQNQRAGFGSPLSKAVRETMRGSWWTDIPRHQWETAIDARWRGPIEAPKAPAPKLACLRRPGTVPKPHRGKRSSRR